ncbi:MAG: type I methionyl aminopeptidase [Nitrospiraceae bacterium]|jgi:methionyl aminopeptidase|nr:type I methionyl aminopeptidase [Nitrospiraceae bacterium]
MIYLKNDSEIEKIQRAGRIVGNALKELQGLISPGISLLEIDKFAEEYAYKNKAKPAFKGYHSYPASICLSVNNVVVHGIPNKYVLNSGDIVGLDYGVELDGYFGDAAITVPVGSVSEEALNLLEVTRRSLEIGIEHAIIGSRIGDISYAIQQYVESFSYSVVRNFVGHGIGKKLHEEPPVPNYGQKGRGVKLEQGMVLALEPMVNIGSPETTILADGWTAVTKDGSLSAHFEHTIAITKSGPRILTHPDK